MDVGCLGLYSTVDNVIPLAEGFGLFLVGIYCDLGVRTYFLKYLSYVVRFSKFCVYLDLRVFVEYLVFCGRRIKPASDIAA